MFRKRFKRARDADTGHFTTMENAEANPSSTVVETVRPQAPEGMDWIRASDVKKKDRVLDVTGMRDVARSTSTTSGTWMLEYGGDEGGVRFYHPDAPVALER